MKSSSEIRYDDLKIGFKFPTVSCRLDKDTISSYLKATEDGNPLYFNESIVPPMTVAIYGRLGYILDMARFELSLPKGLIHAKQMYEFTGVIREDELITTYTEVVDRYIKNNRKYVVIEMVTKNEEGKTVIIGRMTIVWTA
jgi:hypothetical protein